MGDGARGTRTPDLLGAIQALSQLSYSPGCGRRGRISARDGQPIVAGAPALGRPRVGWAVRDAPELPQPPHLLLHPAGDPARAGGRVRGDPDRARFRGGEEQRGARAGAARGRGAVQRRARTGRRSSRRRSAPTTRSRSPCATTTARRSRSGSRSSRARGGAERVRLTLDGEEPVEAGSGEAVAPARSRVVDADGRSRGRWTSRSPPRATYANLLARVTGHEVALTAERRADRRHDRGRRRPGPCR